MKAIFLRALEETEDKSLALRSAINSPEQAMGRTRFDVHSTIFQGLPGSPFAYWAPRTVLRAFSTLESYESKARTALQGASTCDDFRYVRSWWEVSLIPARHDPEVKWAGFARGGRFRRFYSDVPAVVLWNTARTSFHGFIGRPGRWNPKPVSADHYFQPGLTWPLRGSVFSCTMLPSGCAFSVGGKVALAPLGELPFLATVLNSRVFNASITLYAGKIGGFQYETGIINQAPVPSPDRATRALLGNLGRRAWSDARTLDTRTENSHAFHLPALLPMDGDVLADGVDAWSQQVADTAAELASLQAEIDDCCFELYGIDGADREQIERGLGGSSAEDHVAAAEDDEDETTEAEELDAAPLVASLLSWSVGVAFGRFDLRLATGERPPPSEPEPFDPLPACSPGMLTGEDGLPLDAPPASYSIDFPHDGILIDDAGTPRDLVALARQVFEHVFDDPAARWEEAAEILGQRDRTLRRWFARDFFGLHFKQYSKSRRKAPIYWPLSTASGSYTVWLYYHRLTADTLFQVVAEHLEPKLRKTQEELLQVDAAQGRAEGREAAKLAKQAGELAEMEQELEEMKTELLRVAELPYKPNLNDGVQITAAPLSKLFQLKAWRKVLETTWKKLEKGEYDWAHLAYAIWPDRVRDKCKTDRSLAIAHDLEDLCEVEVAPKKKGRKNSNA